MNKGLSTFIMSAVVAGFVVSQTVKADEHPGEAKEETAAEGKNGCKGKEGCKGKHKEHKGAHKGKKEGAEGGEHPHPMPH